MELEDMFENTIEMLILSVVQDDNADLLEDYLSIELNTDDYLNYLYDQPMGQKCTMLTIACLNGYKNVIRMLLNKFKPDLEILNTVRLMDRDQQLETFENVTVLWIAAALNNFDIVKLLVEHGAEVNHRSKTNSTPVRCACCNDNTDMVRYLVQHGADIHITKIKHFTNLVASAFNGHLQMVAYLVDELGCDVNECLDDGRSPLGAAVYHGSLELVQFLLDRGAQNLLADFNLMTPLMLAVEKRRIDLANTIARYCSLVEQIEAEELLGTAFICLELGAADYEQAFKHLSRALELRLIHQLPKMLQESTHEVFNHRQECQTIEQLTEIQSNSNQMYIEALLIRERLLGPKNGRYRHSLRYRGALLFDEGQSYVGLALWMYELALYQQHSIDIDRENLRQFLSIFASMLSTFLVIPIDSLHKVMTVVVEELKRNPTDFDYNLRTLLFLITIASQILLETNLSDSDRRLLYHLIYVIIQHRYTTQTSGASLLHLSLNEQIIANDYIFDRMYKYPCFRTVQILLQCGADVNANDNEQFTPLHVFVSNWSNSNPTILQLLCDAGAHIDYVNQSGETAIDIASNANIEQLLKTRLILSLKCVCARLIQKSKISFHGNISKSLVAFVERH